jgi:hypothetical protein
MLVCAGLFLAGGVVARHGHRRATV